MTSTITAVLFSLVSGSADAVVPRLELAPVARAVLAAFAASPTERLGCLLGSVDGATVRVKSVAETDDSAATATRVVARTPCPPGALGRVHSHPGAERCWYWFPGTQVETSDAVSFRRGGHVVPPDDRESDWSFIKRLARAIHSAALKPSISSSARLTVKYRRPMGAQ